MSFARLKIIRFFSFFILFVLGFLALERVCHLATDGFALVRMTHSLPLEEEFTPPILTPDDEVCIKKILDQPFHYLSCGGQSYVFISQDNHYILKFTKFHHLRIPQWINYLPLPPALNQYREKKIQKKDFVLKRTFRSYVIAYNHFKEESGILYHHLQKTHSTGLKVSFFDKLGYLYEIPLDNYAFVLQKRGMSTYHMINTLMKNNRIEEASQKLSELLHIAVVRHQKGLGDRDFKFKSNLGFINGKAAQIDLGSLYLDDKQQDPHFYRADIYRAGLVLKNWLQKEHPVLVKDFDIALKKTCDINYLDPLTPDF